MAHDRKANTQGGIQSAVSPHEPEDGTGSLGGEADTEIQLHGDPGVAGAAPLVPARHAQGARVSRLHDPEKVKFW